MRRALSVLFVALLAGLALAEDAPAKKARGKSREYREAIRTIETMARAKPPSVALGTFNDGRLRHAAELPARGFGYRLAAPRRPTHFGTDEMVFGLIELAALMQEKRPGSPWLSVGDISAKDGGKLAPHINHQDGQDVDLAFLYCDPASGRPVDQGWLKCDAEGRTKKANAVFDVERNFEMLVLWLESPYFGGCEWILVHEPLEKLLVAHGRALAKKVPKRAAESEAVTSRLEELMREPESSPHDDHFHIRLLKSAEDREASAQEAQ